VLHQGTGLGVRHCGQVGLQAADRALLSRDQVGQQVVQGQESDGREASGEDAQQRQRHTAARHELPEGGNRLPLFLDQQAVLDSQGLQADRIERLWWLFFGVIVAVFVTVPGAEQSDWFDTVVETAYVCDEPKFSVYVSGDVGALHVSPVVHVVIWSLIVAVGFVAV